MGPSLSAGLGDPWLGSQTPCFPDWGSGEYIYSQELCKQYLRVLPTTCAPIATELLEVPGWLIFVVVLSSLTSAIRAFEGPGLNKLFQVGLI
jgi:hypothetical protein